MCGTPKHFYNACACVLPLVLNTYTRTLRFAFGGFSVASGGFFSVAGFLPLALGFFTAAAAADSC